MPTCTFAGNPLIYCFVLYFTVDYGPYDQYLMEWEEQIKNDPGFPLHILYYEDLKDVSVYLSSLAIQHAFLKLSLVNLISKTRTMYSINQLTHSFSLQTSDYDVLSDFCVDSVSLATSFKKCNVIMT